MNYGNLIRRAKQAQKFSHAPYSRLRVGAALLASSGKIYTGCNIENSSFSLTICAERTAIFKAISAGEKKFRAIAVVSDKIENIPPCGACRQVLIDLAGDIEIITSDKKNRPTVSKLSVLLPKSFNKQIFKLKK